ncbi:MAG: ABC transporter substrate-binding protein [Phycisphaerales bacterium]|jgi:ABC-type Fe3+ transport system substrate-binding protein|nr:ABC transporter substrate-binding protein [Phycisphaerales bacterium]
MALKPTWIGWKECVVVALFLIVLLLPLVFEGSSPAGSGAERQLVIVTPHNEQIRSEFEGAFEAWHAETYGEPVDLVWSVPGGTSEIRRMLKAQWAAALKQGRQPGGDADLVFGGGSYEHSKLKQGASAVLAGLSDAEATAWLQGVGVVDAEAAKRSGVAASGVVRADLTTTTAEGAAPEWRIDATASISDVPPIALDQLPAVYGRDTVAGTALWDVDGHWFGTAMSSFGLVANADELQARGLPMPDEWADLAHPKLESSVSMVNPAQSGSVTTAFETILKRLGWAPGWRVLRRAAANARTISASSLRGPTDVAAGDAAMGVSIDFFGRYQQQALADHGAAGRLVYVDPPGQTTLDPDPISMLANPPDPELAARFIEFTLSEMGQSLWQFEPDSGELGPRVYALRRLPVRASLYAQHFDRFMDRVDPFENAATPEFDDRNMRSFIAPLMQAMAMDQRGRLQNAWHAIITHPAYPVDAPGIVTAGDVDDPELSAMLEAFDAMPTVVRESGEVLTLDTPEGRAAIKAGWLRGGWEDEGYWDGETQPATAYRRAASRFFQDQFDQVISGSASQ